MLLAYDDTGDPKWKMVEDKAFEQGQMVPVEMAEDEELDTDKLNDLKNALDDLQIVDVRRKPAGLSGDLKTAKDFAQDMEAQLSLQSKGFYFAPVGDQLELFSNEGDVRCLMKDGVQYVLRFGNIAGDGTPDAPKEEGEEAETDSDSGGMNRYIFVMAEFNADAIEKPELEEVPQVDEPAAEGEAEGEKAAAEATDEASAAENTDAAASEEGATEEKSEAEKERERIEKENQRKQDEYDEKIAEGEKKVKELNDRFADWYYIISDEVYQKIHLTRDQIVKKKEKEEGENGETDSTDAAAATDPLGEPEEPAGPLEEFQNLKQEGPEGGQ